MRVHACALMGLLACEPCAAAKLELTPPPGSVEFGRFVLALPDGRVAVADPGYDLPGAADVGAVHIFGASGVLSSSVYGSQQRDLVGVGLQRLRGGDFLIRSWLRGQGAITLVRRGEGVPATIDANNSLLGGPDGRYVGRLGVTELDNGNFVVLSDGALGAATLVKIAEGTSGVVSGKNSLMGDSIGDFLYPDPFLYPSNPYAKVVALAGGRYAVSTPAWNVGSTKDVGAVTLCAATGCTGPVSALHALRGTMADDRVGLGLTALDNGSIVVHSPYWDRSSIADAGAITWLDASSTTQTAVSEQNSIIGSHVADFVSINFIDELRVTPLDTGDFVLTAPRWDSAAAQDVGAAIWVDGTVGAAGPLSAQNSLVGTSAGDGLLLHAAALHGGKYAVAFPRWTQSPTAASVGAVIVGTAGVGPVGEVDGTIALHGSTTGDGVGGDVAALPNGHLVVGSARWDNGTAQDVGAVTWIDGDAPLVGPVSDANSTVGTTAGDHVGARILPLTNGHYIVASPDWQPVPSTAAGAVTWFNGWGSGHPNYISTTNSLVGSGAIDLVGGGALAALPTGDYVVGSHLWQSLSGAATFGRGTTPIMGVVSAQNSLVGAVGDQLGRQLHALPDGNYVLVNAEASPVAAGSGTVVLASREGERGSADSRNAVYGTQINSGKNLNWSYSEETRLLAVGDPNGNAAAMLKLGERVRVELDAIVPATVPVGEQVTISGLVASSETPALGTVVAKASDGTTCAGTTRVTTDATIVLFSCRMIFATPGPRTIAAAFKDTRDHAAFGPSAPRAVLVDDGTSTLFANGFE